VGGTRDHFFMKSLINLLIPMKKKDRRNHPSESTRRSSKVCRNEGRWAFNLTSERLFALGSTDRVRRVAYRTATGELRILPL